MRRGREERKHWDAGREEVKVERRSGMRWRGEGGGRGGGGGGGVGIAGR